MHVLRRLVRPFRRPLLRILLRISPPEEDHWEKFRVRIPYYAFSERVPFAGFRGTSKERPVLRCTPVEEGPVNLMPGTLQGIALMLRERKW